MAERTCPLCDEPIRERQRTEPVGVEDVDGEVEVRRCHTGCVRRGIRDGTLTSTDED